MSTSLQRAARALCHTAARLLASSAPVNDRGVALDAHLHGLLSVQSRLPVAQLGQGANVRRMRAETVHAGAIVAPTWPGIVPREHRLAGLPARVYRPPDAPSSAPALLFLHGGGWVVGNRDSHDGLCRVLAGRSGCVVVSVEYRLAPESPWPAAVRDAVVAFDALQADAARLGIDPQRVAMGGDSAGGNLTAVACLVLRDRAEDEDTNLPAMQVLIYPAVDMVTKRPSRRLFERGYYLEDAAITWFLDQYVPHRPDRAHWQASPIRAANHADLPPAVIVTAGFDPLRDEGEEYGRVLEEAGVPVTLHAENALIHGFANMGGMSDASYAATLRIADAVREGLAS